MLTIADSIKTSLFTSNHNISHHFALLPSLRCQLDMPIPIEHWKEPVCSVSATALSDNREINAKNYLQTGVFRAQLLVYGVVWCTEWIYVRFIDRWAWKSDSRTRPVWYNTVTSLAIEDCHQEFCSNISEKLTLKHDVPPLTDSGTWV